MTPTPAKGGPTALVWFRRDLRLHDHPALTAASEASRVVCLYVLDDRLLSGRFASPNRSWFLRESLLELADNLRSFGNDLLVVSGQPETVVPALARETGASAVFVSRDHSPFGRARDRAVASALAESGTQFVELPGGLVHAPEDVRTAGGSSFVVFGPFYRRWSELEPRALLPVPDRIPPPPRLPRTSALNAWHVERPAAAILPGGESAARIRFVAWALGGLDRYSEARDFPGQDGTSRLSQDFRWGLLSPAEVLETAANVADPQFKREMAWRDFYHALAWHNPRVLREPFRAEYAGLPWANDPANLAAWEEGRTGFPMVDAAMRQLVATGWMHNRARMVAASFLTKNLFVDYRHGERFFMRHLVDGDVAVNNGGWQWASSTGTDAQPYFRVFNPVLQGERFDPDGAYVRRWVPELSEVPLRYVHKPWTMTLEVQRAAGCLIGVDYPAPIAAPDGAVDRARHFFAAARR